MAPKIISKGKDKDVGEGFRTSRRRIGECAIKSCPWFWPLKKNTKEIDQANPKLRSSSISRLIFEELDNLFIGNSRSSENTWAPIGDEPMPEREPFQPLMSIMTSN